MNRLPLSLLSVAASIVLVGTVMAIADEDAVTLNRINGYREWKKVNPEPVRVEIPLNIDPSSVI